MTLPVVSLTTAKVSWTDPTQGTDGQPLSGGDAVTGYKVGLRSLTAAGSVAGTYPFTASVGPTLTSEAVATVLGASMVADSYAAAVQAQSANGASAWSAEFSFQGSLPVPLAPTAVSVA